MPDAWNMQKLKEQDKNCGYRHENMSIKILIVKKLRAFSSNLLKKDIIPLPGEPDTIG
jgi:hypothetical protein